jgi:hypothetical protein
MSKLNKFQKIQFILLNLVTIPFSLLFITIFNQDFYNKYLSKFLYNWELPFLNCENVLYFLVLFIFYLYLYFLIKKIGVKFEESKFYIFIIYEFYKWVNIYFIICSGFYLLISALKNILPEGTNTYSFN